MRNSLQYLKDQNQSQLVGVEIGVWRGENALNILQNLDIKMLYLVDSYELYPEWNENEVTPFVDMEANRANAVKILEPYKDKITWVVKRSDKAALDVPDNLDFVYIDGNHSEKAVLQDLPAWYPKVKYGGLFSGHDWWKPEVSNSVKTFAKEHGHDISHYDKPKFQTWDQAGIDKMDWWFVR